MPDEPINCGKSINQIGDFWDKKLLNLLHRPKALRSHWWDDPVTLRHINQVVCGEAIDGVSAGFHRRIGEIISAQGWKSPRGISIGCGTGMKELWLLQTGAVESMDCYELGPTMVETGRAAALKHGLEDRLRFYLGDPLKADLRSDFDLVYWNNSLHHMDDPEAVFRWSKNRLRPGGLLAFDDYVGPNRFQFSTETLQAVNQAMRIIPAKHLCHASDPTQKLPRQIVNWDPQKVAQDDPSEAPASARIIPAFRQAFPFHQVIPTGGCLYFLALNHAFGNFVSEEEVALLQAILHIDLLITRNHETAYAVGFGLKTLN